MVIAKGRECSYCGVASKSVSARVCIISMKSSQYQRSLIMRKPLITMSKEVAQVQICFGLRKRRVSKHLNWRRSSGVKVTVVEGRERSNWKILKITVMRGRSSPAKAMMNCAHWFDIC
jgi:hypothetical protein